MENLLGNITVCKGNTSDGLRYATDNTTFYSRPIDMSNCGGCLWIIHGCSESGADNSTLFVFPQCCSSTGGTFVSLTSESGIRTTALKKDSADEKLILLDVVRPIDGSSGARKYHRLLWKGTTGDFVITAIKYNLRRPGTTSTYTDPSTFLGARGAAKILVSPTS